MGNTERGKEQVERLNSKANNGVPGKTGRHSLSKRKRMADAEQRDLRSD